MLYSLIASKVDLPFSGNLVSPNAKSFFAGPVNS
nr:MAG TPA: hypothetical protein [Bacteriophage sp.]